MLRRLMILLLMLGLAPVIWLREPLPPESFSQTVAARALPLPSVDLGPFVLTGAWQLTSPNSSFGGFSTLTVSSPGRLTTFSDTGMRLDMPQPGLSGAVWIAPLIPRRGALKAYRDVDRRCWTVKPERCGWPWRAAICSCGRASAQPCRQPLPGPKLQIGQPTAGRRRWRVLRTAAFSFCPKRATPIMKGDCCHMLRTGRIGLCGSNSARPLAIGRPMRRNCPMGGS